MKLIKPPVRYDTVEDFYAEVPDADRRLSPQITFGTQWTELNEVGWTWPRSQLVWIEATGELCVIRRSVITRRELSDFPIKIIAVVERRDVIEEILEGWRFHNRAEGLGWIYRRLEIAAAAAAGVCA